MPEIYNGQVEIKNIAREAGHRSKVAVAALQDGIDPVGACVGMRGIRIQNIVKELHNEKIDVIEWNNDAVAFISKALSPARVTGVYLDDDPIDGKTAVVLVPEDQLSLAIGREGQNARLAAKLTGWRIDIKSVSETVLSALENLDAPPLNSLPDRYADLIAESLRILEKKRLDLAIMPEEYKTLARLASIVEQLLQEQRDEAREVFLKRRQAIRTTLPPKLFELPLDVMAVSQDMLDALEPFENVGEVMLNSLADEELVKRRLAAMPGKPMAELDGEPMAELQAETMDVLDGEPESALLGEPMAELQDDPMADLQAALDIIMAADIDQLLAEAISIEESDEELEPETIEAAGDEEQSATSEAESDVDGTPADETLGEGEQPEILYDAFGQPIVPVAAKEEADDSTEQPTAAEIVIEPVTPAVDKPTPRDSDAAPVFESEDEAERDFELDLRKGKNQRRTDRQKRRQLVLDEQSGEVIAKRRRKGGRETWDEETWEDYDF